MTAKSKPIPKSRRRFPPEFKAEAVRLVTDHGLSQTQVGRDLGASPKAVSRWVREAKERSAPGATHAMAATAPLQTIVRRWKCLSSSPRTAPSPWPSSRTPINYPPGGCNAFWGALPAVSL